MTRGDKKSDLYSSIWASCDELRGGMDASQYKDYVLTLLFIKYVSDKYADYEGFEPPITIPKGASFKDMAALKGKSDIGEKINTQIIAPLVEANTRLARADFPDFNDPNKLGDGDAKVKRLTNLVAIFENPALDFSHNRAENDDILGDAYEYLMRHFATQSGKSKGQFYTPAEVSRVITFEELFRSTLDGASVHPREVVKHALQYNAAAVIFTHNHPSGIAEPSDADRRLTQRLKDALALVDIRTLDHFVVGGAEVVSFAERGLL